MPELLALIAPQRSTQYADWVNALAIPELELSPLAGLIQQVAPLRLGGLDYLQLTLTDEPTAQQLAELGQLALTSAFFWRREGLGEAPGTLLQPIEVGFQPALPPEIVVTRRYRGKTNELFTQFLCTVCRGASAFAATPWRELRLFDPLSGGGTTLFIALVLGADAAGVEHDAQDVESTATFVEQFMRQQGIACRVRKERLRLVGGQRWEFLFGRDQGQRLVLAHGETGRSAELIVGFKPQLLVADLPYGIQHRGELVQLLREGLPVWGKLLPRGGAMALAWEASRFPRRELIGLVEGESGLRVLNDPPYQLLVHRVDRVIKRRDVLVARKED
jgi:hypothetical protein